jgi:hypothetical protein
MNLSMPRRAETDQPDGDIRIKVPEGSRQTSNFFLGAEAEVRENDIHIGISLEDRSKMPGVKEPQ